MMQNFDIDNISFIQDRACERIVEIFDALGIEFTERYDYLQAACPVHCGDNQRAMFWAIRSNHFECKTRGCHKDPITGPSSSVFGLVRGAMFNKTGEKWSFNKSVNFVVTVLGLKNVDIDKNTVEDIEISKIIKKYKKTIRSKPVDGIPLSTVVSLLESDDNYYPNRGVSEKTIAKYHISFCNNKKKPMYKRSFFPILDVTGKYIMGWSGRSIYSKCDKCSMHHNEDDKSCPDKQDMSKYTKWKHSKDFSSESCLYNIWYAKPFIQKTGTVILCEGPGDVWAYEQAGIRNSVALMGVCMSKKQRLILQNAGALTIICTFDNDAAGKNAVKKIQKDLIYYFRIFNVTLDNVKDIGEMMKDDIIDKIYPVLRQTSKAKILSCQYTTGDKND